MSVKRLYCIYGARWWDTYHSMINSQRGVKTGSQCIKSHMMLLLAIGLGSPSAGVIIVRPLQLFCQVVGRGVKDGVRVIITTLVGNFAPLTAVARPFAIALIHTKEATSQ